MANRAREYIRCFSSVVGIYPVLSGNETHYPKVSGRFPMFLQAKPVKVVLIRPWPMRTISFPILYSHTTLIIDATHSAMTWLSKPLMQRTSKAGLWVNSNYVYLHTHVHNEHDIQIHWTVHPCAVSLATVSQIKAQKSSRSSCSPV
jgi:hypothetical protein